MNNNPVMKALTWAAEHFIGVFNASAESFVDLVTGVLPLLMVMLTFMYAVTTWIGEERVTRAVQWAGKYAITRYTLMPILAVLLLTNPMAYTFGRFLPERYKPAFYDSAVSFVHPVTALFPHANAGEIFVCNARDPLLHHRHHRDLHPRLRYSVDDQPSHQARRTRSAL